MNKLLVGADVVLLIVSIWKYSRMPSEIPLFYSRAWGEDQIVDAWYLILLPVFMHIFFFTNQYLYEKYFEKQGISPVLLTVVNTVVIVSFSTITLKILFLVT